jgi:hypothetical protein
VPQTTGGGGSTKNISGGLISPYCKLELNTAKPYAFSKPTYERTSSDVDIDPLFTSPRALYPAAHVEGCACSSTFSHGFHTHLIPRSIVIHTAVVFTLSVCTVAYRSTSTEPLGIGYTEKHGSSNGTKIVGTLLS